MIAPLAVPEKERGDCTKRGAGRYKNPLGTARTPRLR